MAWTVIPVLILVVIAIPSFRLLKLQLEVPPADITVKVTGKQWYWSYEYPQDGGAFTFDSLMLDDEKQRPRRSLATRSPPPRRRASWLWTTRRSCRSARSCACRSPPRT